MSPNEARPFELAGSSPLRVLWVLLPVLAVLVISVYVQFSRTRAPAPWMEVTLSPPFFLMNGSAAWSIAVLVLIGVGLGTSFFRRRVELVDGVLDVRSTLYRRRTPVRDMLLDQAEVVDLAQDRRYGIRFKTNGYSMPGFYSGHMRLQGGGKGFALVTDRHRTLAIPVRGGSTLLLSMERPQALLDALRKVAAAAPRQ
ncbi:PH domain-containing protein [Stenotrophomonas sp. TWI143]|uniref:PH domain-containing protein n=1 Tax=unclassified Stenotrophomonas TaxID=196198 RepID=UPI0024B589BD|nr:PH domain-containing protein [Stenotrophomonas sp. RS-48]MDI9250440.1 PH domain-containing protein [Stenotrophomonas sp. RS-48]HDS1219323.1 hypothetical protein [Stenotrophomonas maltophilia]HDS1231980.1 hypothetical protein [Stenotrophomonas maltophilia]